MSKGSHVVAWHVCARAKSLLNCVVIAYLLLRWRPASERGSRTVAPSPTDAADAWDVIEMGVLADNFQIELPSERGDPDVVFGDGLALGS